MRRKFGRKITFGGNVKLEKICKYFYVHKILINRLVFTSTRRRNSIMILRELVRLSSQNRTLYCYLILSVWIFLLIAGMYKYIGANNFQSFLTAKQYNHFLRKEESSRIQKYQQDCNPIQSIVRKEDGGILDGWNLQGVLLLTRHGDRGPMSHVKGMSLVDCGQENDPLLHKYKTFLANLTNGATGLTTNHPSWTKVGPFHSFPLLPAFAKNCMLGQLTYKGIAQLLHVGDVMRQIYGNQLGLLSKPFMQRQLNNTSQPNFISDEIVVYSTRYRRTFQSAMALLFSFLPTERWQSLSIRESHSLAFCFLDCACPQADFLNNQMEKETVQQLSKHPTVAASVQWIGANLLQNPSPKLKAMEVRDAVLSIICHNAAFPCKNSFNVNGEMIRQPASTTDPSEIINIDQDDVGNDAGVEINKLAEHSDSSETETSTNGCIESNHVAALLSYTNWQGQRESDHKFTKYQGILRAYGIIRSIVNYMLKMVSGDKTKFVLYSGHDRTIQFLTAALGIKSQSYIVPYAARVIFEVYKSDKETEFYFRLVYNGIDVTREIDFCEGGKSLRVTKDSRGNKADLCPIENIIRFIHDDYFTSLNATNFKDACTIQKKNEF